MKDEYLFKLLKRGEREAFKQIYDRYINELTKISNSVLNDPWLAEDCVQQYFMQLWVRRKKIKNTDNLKGYLITGIYYRSKDFLRAKKRYSTVLDNYKEIKKYERQTSEE